MRRTILFFANDIGGGNLLLHVFAKARKTGIRTVLLASGPSFSDWKLRGLKPRKLHEKASRRSIQKAIDSYRPTMVVSGTSVSSSNEKLLWKICNLRRIKTVALIDGWVKIPDRFPNAKGIVNFPCWCGVVDRQTANIVKNISLTLGRKTKLIGHPHLEQSSKKLRKKRSTRISNEVPVIAFFSTPLVNDEATLGIEALTLLLPELGKYAEVAILVKPHPRESIKSWKEWFHSRTNLPVGVDLHLVDRIPTEVILESIDMAIGLPSTVLIEAAFGGIKSLVVNFEYWKFPPNPGIQATFEDQTINSHHDIAEKVKNLIYNFNASSHMETKIFIPSSTPSMWKLIRRVLRTDQQNCSIRY